MIYPYVGKVTSFFDKKFFAFDRVYQTLSRPRLRRFLLFIADALQLQKVRRARRYIAVCSHSIYTPRVLRVTYGHSQTQRLPVNFLQEKFLEREHERGAFFKKPLSRIILLITNQSLMGAQVAVQT